MGKLGCNKWRVVTRKLGGKPGKSEHNGKHEIMGQKGRSWGPNHI